MKISSGSVLSPLITKELMLRDCPTIVVAVGDQSTKLFTQNTVNTLKSYEAIARNNEFPIPLAYYYNEGSKSVKQVNRYITVLLEALRCLFSNQHYGLDSQDLFHWLRYDKVTDYPPQLSCLTMVGAGEDLSKVYGKAITVATLGSEDEETDYPDSIEYQTTGIISEDNAKTIQSKTTHFVISDGMFDHVIKDLDKVIKKIDDEKESRIKRESLVKSSDNIQESDLIL